MKTAVRMIVLLLVGMVALSGCATVRSLLSGHAGVTSDSSAAEVVAEPSVPRFTFFDSWASW